jgi:mannan endo-1,4-beta-mannosidase
MRLTRFVLAAFAACALNLYAADTVVTVHTAQVLGPISPYIYGVNQKPGDGTNTTVWRLGGNRLTGCNWETNFSNAGNDWKHFNDLWLCTSALGLTDCDQPGAIFKHFVEGARDRKMDALVTIPMSPYVAADKDGTVTPEETAPSKRWVQNLPFLKGRKGQIKFPPNRNDKAVYEDELVSYLVNSFGTADKGGVKFFALDNETAIWPSTHPRIHPKPVRYDEIMNLTEEYATMITRLDPAAQVVGPASYGWQEFLTLQNAPDSGEWNAKLGTFLDYYLDSLARLSKNNGRRLLHVLDLHFYPEAQGDGKRITEGLTTPGAVDARLQAPRSLWDDTYVEDSWITKHSTQGKPIRLIPWAKEIIAKRYPGTQLGFSEYDYGAGNHVSGGLALADVLGIYGREGVYLACLWSDWKPYLGSAFMLYRNYDGKGSTFGDTAVGVANPDPVGLSVYASTDTKRPGKLWVVAINKNQKDSAPLSLNLDGGAYAKWASYGFGADTSDVKPLGEGKVVKGVLAKRLLPLSATLFVVE